MNDRERKAGTVPAAVASTERKEVAIVRNCGARQTRQQFHFDEVLGSFSSQDDVFAATLQPLVSQVLAGFEATAFAYGQTGTGKTYTMEGDADSEDRRGLMARAFAAVLDELAQGSYTDYGVTVSYLEIYNEELSDLLVAQGSGKKLELMDSLDRGVCCVGLSEVPVSSLAGILDLVRRAQERRRVAETQLNARSSRSHCIFTMKVRTRRSVGSGELENVGKLHLVDLAGSECAKKAAYVGNDADASKFPTVGSQDRDRHSAAVLAEQDRERRNINQSLLTLGRVIAALREKNGRVPYRDSKLTRMLRDALGGSCRTVLIACISPAMGAAEETSSTLTYAEQASGIQNRPIASSLFRTTRGTEVRVGDGSNTSVGNANATEWAEVELKLVYMSQEVEEAQAALARKHQEMQEWQERAERAEDTVDGVRAELAKSQEKLEESRSLHGAAVQTARELRSELCAVADKAQAKQSAIAQSAIPQMLRARRVEEETLLSSLKAQRVALEEDVQATLGALNSTRSELTVARAEVTELRSAQTRARNLALKAIVAEFQKLDALADDGDSTVLCHLDTASARADEAANTASATLARGASACDGALVAAGELSRAAAAGYESIGSRYNELVQESADGTAIAVAGLETMAAASQKAANGAEAGAIIWNGAENLDGIDLILTKGEKLATEAPPPRNVLREVNCR